MIALLLCGFMRLNAREAVNDLSAPESRKDLETIQKSVERVIPQARAATVCIEIDEGSGTGVIVSEDGLVLTAAHVATRVNKKATVILEDGTRLKAKTLGLVADKDAAMVQILDKGTYPFVEIDRAESTRLGDWVFSLGHAGGFDKERGSVVRLGRLVRIAGATFQSDCMLIGGDSGGPLFDLSGKLVGIHSRVGQQAQVNMHVPLAEFVANWDGLINGEFIGEGPYAEKPEKGNGYLGLATNSSSEGGLIVTKVGLKSPAELAGIKNGDVLLKLNEVHLEKREQMQEMLKNLSAGDEVSFEIKRAGKLKTITFNLGER
ncbi:MAG: trypsin-like peptidase domain-containing protein [Akkermansiaceae bacterium]|nr:trypsin-like peptidase domain-containing protein [Akkermansiaceae bacterium]